MTRGRSWTRALWVTNDFPPRAGGIEQFLANLLAQRDPGSTRVLTSPWAGDGAHDAALPYAVQRIGRRPLLPSRRLARAIDLVAQEHAADVVVLGALWPLGEVARAVSRPVVALTHGHEAGMVRVGLGPLVRRAAASVDAIGYISDFTRRALVGWVGDAPLVKVPPGVDVDLFTPDVDGSPIRARHGIAPEAPLVVCVSRLVSRKGQDVLVEAWPAVRARVPDARLLLVGTGPLAGALARRISALRLQGAVTLAGEVDWADLPRYHAAADVFAMPCRTRLAGLDVEGFGIVYLEAQASGTAVIAGRSGGAPEAVRDGETGIVVDGTSVAAVAEAVIDLLRDPERRAAMGRAGRQAAVRAHAWSAVALDLEELLAAPTTAGGHRDPRAR